MGVRELAKQILIQRENKRYERLLAGRQVSYGDWLCAREREQAELLKKEMAAAPSGRADFVLFIVGSGEPAGDAVKNIECFFMRHPEAQLVYGDEDVWEMAGEGTCVKKEEPWFKPDWSPDLFDSCFYFGSLVAVREELLERVPVERAGEAVRKAPKLDGVACYRVVDMSSFQKWVYWCVCAAGGYAKGGMAAVGHFDGILFHGESLAGQRLFQVDSEALRQRRQEYVRDFRDGEGGGPAVSVVVPSRDHPALLKKCLQAVERAAEGLSLEILVVDNGSSPENREKIDAIRRELTDSGVKNTYLYRPMEFNFSRMCNLGADAAEGGLLLFLNDDVELSQPGCLWEMAALASRAFTGAVGLKLLYPDTGRIQHAGITNLPMGPVHKLQGLENDACHYPGFGGGWRNYLAVTAACLMVEREKFREAGGFSEELPVAFNDVDFCFRLYELGCHNVCINSSFAYHCESVSRGDDESAEKLERLQLEREKLYERHPELASGYDPYYSPYLNRDGLDVRVRPAYLTSRNEAAVLEAVRIVKEPELQDFRQDACLTVRVEDAREGRLAGWSAVLGDDNACYEKKLLLKNVESGTVYGADPGMAYRPDLEENMPDQKNVALCGFILYIGENVLPGGRYQVGMSARNRVTGLRLLNWSNRLVELQGA